MNEPQALPLCIERVPGKDPKNIVMPPASGNRLLQCPGAKTQVKEFSFPENQYKGALAGS
jgi:hypothetical protein